MAVTSRRRLRLALLLLGGTALLLVAAWIVWISALDWALAGGRLESWVNRRPERLRIAWRTIQVSPLGAIDIDGLRIAGRSERRLWEVDAEHASGRLVATPLFWRTLRFADIRARGVTVHARAVGEPPGASATTATEPAHRAGGGEPSPVLPEIAGFPPGPPPALAATAALPWSFEFEVAALDELTEVWLDDRRFSGHAGARGGFAIRRRTFAEVFDSQLTFRDVRVEAGGRDVADGCTGSGRFRVVPWRYRGAPLAEVARRFVGRVDLAGELQPREIVDYLFSGWSWLELPDTGARVEATAALDRGRWLPPSRITGELAGARVALFDFEARGDARLSAEVAPSAAGPALTSVLQLGRWTFSRRDEAPLGEGEGLAIAARSLSPALGAGAAGSQLDLDLGRVRIADLGRLEFLWPAGSIDSLASDDAALSGKLHLDAGKKTGEGDVRLAIRRLAAVVRGESVVGDVELDLHLADADLPAARFAIDGSALVLRDFSTLTSKGDAVGGWQGSLRVPQGRLVLRRPFSGAGDLEVRLADTRPIVALWDARRDLPGWAQRLLTLDRVLARGRFAIDPAGATLEDLQIPLTEHSYVRATARWGRAQRLGRLLLAWRRLAVGVEISPRGRDLHLRDAEAWFLSPLPPALPPLVPPP